MPIKKLPWYEQRPAKSAPLPGQLIVSVRPGAIETNALTEATGYLRRNAGVLEMRPLFAEPSRALRRRSAAAGAGDQPAPAPDALARLHTCQLDPKRIDAALLRKLRANPSFEFVEAMPARFLAGAPDPELNHQWGLTAVRWFKANRASAATITVAVLDTGLDDGHPDLKRAIRAYHPMGFAKEDILGHGTHVAGIVGAVSHNSIGIAGVAECKVEVWKVFPDQATDGQFYVDASAYLQALRQVLDAAPQGVRVLNLSISGEDSSQVEQILFDELRLAGVTVVAAMGNAHDQGNPTYYPAAYEGVVAVGAVDASYRRWNQSNTGKHLALSAPGAGILSTVPRRKSDYRAEVRFASWNGTSMAAPHVSGAAALYLARHPAATPEDVRQALLRTCRRVPGMGNARATAEYGRGLLDLQKLLA